MTAQIAAQFAAMRDCWITGAAAAAYAPDEWKGLLCAPSAEENERRLLALVGQSMEVAFRPALPADVTLPPELPRLRLPTLPEALRPLFRKAIKISHSNGTYAAVCLRLLAHRGFSAHPLDGFPGEENDLYAPWQDWASSLEGAKTADDELTIDNWEYFPPAQRRSIIKAMRQQEPARAREILAAKIAQEPAEKRLALLETLSEGLGDEDIPWLQSLTTDRSAKVKQLACRLLARLKQKGSIGQEELTEFAGFFVVGRKGLLRRTLSVTLKPTPSNANKMRRQTLFGQCSLLDLATALGLEEAELIDGWEFSNEDETAFVDMVLGTASSDLVARLAERLLASEYLQMTVPLIPRLEVGLQTLLMEQILAGSHEQATLLAHIEYCDIAQDILSSRAYRSLKAHIKKVHDLESVSPLAFSQLNAFASVATQDAARAVLDDACSSFGLLSVAPSLAFLRLNAELTPTH